MLALKDNKSEEYLRLQPFGQVPAFEDGEVEMFESEPVKPEVFAGGHGRFVLALNAWARRAEITCDRAGLICTGPRQGKQFTYALLDERAGPARAVSNDEALALLVRRFFAGFNWAFERLSSGYGWLVGRLVRFQPAS